MYNRDNSNQVHKQQSNFMQIIGNKKVTQRISPAMLYGRETWSTKIEDIRKMQRSEMRMLRWMTGVSLSERKSNECVRNILAIDDIAEVMR